MTIFHDPRRYDIAWTMTGVRGVSSRVSPCGPVGFKHPLDLSGMLDCRTLAGYSIIPGHCNAEPVGRANLLQHGDHDFPVGGSAGCPGSAVLRLHFPITPEQAFPSGHLWQIARIRPELRSPPTLKERSTTGSRHPEPFREAGRTFRSPPIISG